MVLKRGLLDPQQQGSTLFFDGLLSIIIQGNCKAQHDAREKIFTLQNFSICLT